MKIIASLLVVFLASSWSAYGKAYFFTRSELIEKSQAIAIIRIEEPEAAKSVGESRDPFAEEVASGKIWTYAKLAKVRVERVLKGKLPGQFVIYGHESFICAHCPLSKGRFLAFLSKDGELWVGANWHLSLRPIQGDEVEWYVSEDQRFPMKFQKMDSVISQIQATLKKQQSDQDVELKDRD